MEAGGVRQLGEALAALGKRVLLWDRPNCGLSDLHFEGDNESAMHGRTLTGLIRALGLGPTALAGGSAGSRVSLLAAVQDPEAVSHLVQWWISGGTVSLMMLGASYDCEPAVAASMGGMAAVEKLTTFTEQLTRNPRARDQLLAQDPAVFVATMERWAEAFIPQQDSPVPGMSAADWAALKMPVMIFLGSESDIYHHRRITEWAHRLIPHSRTGRAAVERRCLRLSHDRSAGERDQPAGRLADAGAADRGVHEPLNPSARNRSASPASRALPRGMTLSSTIIRVEWMPQQCAQSAPSGATPRKNIAPGTFSST